MFLLSPAHCGGRRAASLLHPQSPLPITGRLRAGTLTLGEAFSFCSGLYFRGKLAYARRFARTPDATLVITPTRGLQSPDMFVTVDLLREFASVDISAEDARYREPLDRDVRALTQRIARGVRVVLLGSIATGKYVDVLAGWLAQRLYFPSAFVGRGDMSRGGLLLRHAASGVELEYSALEAHTPRRGRRPPTLDPRTRVTVASAAQSPSSSSAIGRRSSS